MSLVTGLATGLLAGLLGLGGGLVRRPALSYIVRTPEDETRAIGHFTVLATSVVGTAAHWQSGNVQWALAALLCAGGIVAQALGRAWSSPLAATPAARAPKITYVVSAAGLLVAQVLKIAGRYGLAKVWVVCLAVAVCAWIALLARSARRQAARFESR